MRKKVDHKAILLGFRELEIPTSRWDEFWNSPNLQMASARLEALRKDFHAAWRRRAPTLHPDRNSDPAAAKRLSQLNVARKALNAVRVVKRRPQPMPQPQVQVIFWSFNGDDGTFTSTVTGTGGWNPFG